MPVTLPGWESKGQLKSTATIPTLIELKALAMPGREENTFCLWEQVSFKESDALLMISLSLSCCEVIGKRQFIL